MIYNKCYNTFDFAYIYIVISHADTIMFLWIFKNKDKYLTFQVLHAQKTKLAVKKNIK